MVLEPIKPNNTTSTQVEKQKLLLDQEIREMISVLTRRLADIQHDVHKPPPGSSHLQVHEVHNNDHDHNDNRGIGIITLTGSNTGAAMQGKLDDKSNPSHRENVGDAYVNSNFQAINNSIMLGGSYSTNDPGVHMDMTVSDYDLQQHSHPHAHMKHGKVFIPKKKEKDPSRSSDQHYSSQPSSD